MAKACANLPHVRGCSARKWRGESQETRACQKHLACIRDTPQAAWGRKGNGTTPRAGHRRACAVATRERGPARDAAAATRHGPRLRETLPQRARWTRVAAEP